MRAWPRPVLAGTAPRAPIAVAWVRFQARTQALGERLGGEALFVTSRWPRRAALLPLRYATCAWSTWRQLQERDPSLVLVVTPPVVAPLVAWLWCRRRSRPLVVDCHPPETFHGRKWAWARPLLRPLLAGSRAALVHTDDDLRAARSWEVPALLLPDDVADVSQAELCPAASRPTVLVAGSLDANEPVAETVAAAGLMPEVQFRFTGDVRGCAVPLDGAPRNVTFTGFLPYPRFLGEMRSAHAVAVFSIDPHTMNRAAQEAAGLGRPLVVSNLPALRRRLGDGALYARNEAADMAVCLRRALAEAEKRAVRSQAAGERLRLEWQEAFSRFRAVLPELEAAGR